MSAVEYLLEYCDRENWSIPNNIIEEALDMEKKQIFKSKNISAKEAYKAGQHSMYCGCYEISGCTNYEEWLYKKIKSDDY